MKSQNKLISEIAEHLKQKGYNVIVNEIAVGISGLRYTFDLVVEPSTEKRYAIMYVRELKEALVLPILAVRIDTNSNHIVITNKAFKDAKLVLEEAGVKVIEESCLEKILNILLRTLEK